MEFNQFYFVVVRGNRIIGIHWQMVNDYWLAAEFLPQQREAQLATMLEF